MTDEQKVAITALRGCWFVPGSSHKRFVAALAVRLDLHPDRPLTEPQARRLRETLHRFRRQHRACPCGAYGTLLGRAGEPMAAARCAACAGILPQTAAAITVPPAAPVPLPGRPYPWLMEERPEPSRVRRVCLSCGESAEVGARKRGRVTTFPGFAQWYRDHIPCGERWEGFDTKGEGQDAPCSREHSE